jgi:hypothetical protein
MNNGQLTSTDSVQQLLLPFMVSRPRKAVPDLARVRRSGGAPIEVKRAVFQSRRLHRKGQYLQAWNLLLDLPDDYDDYRELIDARIFIASWAKPLDRSQTCLWAKWIVQAEPESLWAWYSLEFEVYMQHGPLAALEVLYQAQERFPGPFDGPAPDWNWCIAHRLCQAGRSADAEDIVEQMVEYEPVNRDFLLDEGDFYPLWPFIRTLPVQKCLR